MQPNKRPPVKYRRPIPKDMVKKSVSLVETFYPGTLLEFVYGHKQKPGQVGGWKNDRKPVLLVFHDDGHNYIEGLNTNYLSNYYIAKLKYILKIFPGIDGEQMYNIIKKTAAYAIKKGYRKYIRESLRDRYVYLYKDEQAQELQIEEMNKEREHIE